MKKITVMAVAVLMLIGSVSAVHAESRVRYEPRIAPAPEAYYPEPRPTMRKQPYVARAVVDMAIARPLGLAATVVGSALWVAWLPFTAPTGSMDKAAQGLVIEPFRFTFVRPIGELKQERKIRRR